MGIMKMRSGFTMAELVIILAVFGMIGSITLISFSDVSKRRLEAQTSKIASDIRQTARKAVIEGKKYRITFDPTGNRYTLKLINEMGTLNIIKTYPLPKGHSFTINTLNIDYSPRGTVSTGATLTMENDKYMQEVTIVPVTGRVNIKSAIKKK